MLAFFAHRLLTVVATLLVVSALLFGVLEAPAWQRYLDWLAALLRADLGVSYAYGEPVWDLLRQRLSVTLPLTLLALGLSALLAIPLGLYAAAHQGRPVDTLLMGVAQMGMALPSFWLAMVLILLFSVHGPWLAAGGFPGWSAQEGGGLWPALQALVLPALSLAAVQTAILARTTRAAMLDVLGEDFIRTACAKGLGRHALLWGHALRNALVPVLALLGLQFAHLLAGAIVVENVFYLPGLGRLLLQAVANRDLVLVRNGVLLLAALVVLVGLVVDVLHAWIDPRRQGQRA